MKLAIQILKDNRNRPFDYGTWIDGYNQDFGPLITLEDIHSCGTTACAGGYIAADPRTSLELHRYGMSGYIYLPGHDCDNDYALATWLDIPTDHAESIFLFAEDFFPNLDNAHVTIDHVIELLEHYLEHEDLPERKNS